MGNLIKFIELIKFPLVYISAFFLSSSCFIFVPDQFLVKLGVKEIRDNYRSYIGVIFIISFSIIFVNALVYVVNKYKKKYNDYKWKKAGKSTLKDLSNAEKDILIKMLTNGSNSLEIDMSRGLHKRLEYYKIIYRASNVSTMGTWFSYSIQPWASEFLRKNRHFLDIK